MQLEIGKTYWRRNRKQKRKIVAPTIYAAFPWRDEDGDAYTEDGFFHGNRQESPLDLVAPADEPETATPTGGFAVGDRVTKPKGYRFVGVVVAAFDKLDGGRRYVVENADGLLHIFNGGQLAAAKPKPVDVRELLGVARECDGSCFVPTAAMPGEIAGALHRTDGRAWICDGLTLDDLLSCPVWNRPLPDADKLILPPGLTLKGVG